MLPVPRGTQNYTAYVIQRSVFGQYRLTILAPPTTRTVQVKQDIARAVLRQILCYAQLPVLIIPVSF